MKKEINCLIIEHHESGPTTSAGDCSPHQSTSESKGADRTVVHGIHHGCVFGESATISAQQEKLFPSSRSIELPDVTDAYSTPQPKIRFRCVSTDSAGASAQTDSETMNEYKLFFAPIAHQALHTEVSESIVRDVESPTLRQKRQRNPSLTQDAFDEASHAMDEDDCVDQPRKRRRMHERRHAMDSSVFAFILQQIST